MFRNRCCNQMMGFGAPVMGGCCCNQPDPCNDPCERDVVEPTINKCVEREFYHEVPQV